MKATMVAGVSSVVALVLGGAAATAVGGCHTSSGAGTSLETACGDLFTSLIARCDLTGYPQSEIARQAARWNTYCSSLPNLPGSMGTSDAVEACAKAAAGLGCSYDSLPIACTSIVSGSLAGGAACFVGSQCSSGDCAGVPGAGGVTPACGECETLVPVGSPCGGQGESCGPDAICGFAEDGGRTCAVLSADAGAGNAQAGDASPMLAAAGAPCDTATALPCGPGLGCAENNVCVALEFAAAGQPCDDYAKSCLVGDCANATQTPLPDGGTMNVDGVCPMVLADGQPCDLTSATAVCDAFATCIDGTCVLAASATTCM